MNCFTPAKASQLRGQLKTGDRMSKVLQHKVVAELPSPLEPDSIYYVRKGAGFNIHVTNGVGVVTAYSLNADLELDGKVDSNDPRLTDSREWSEDTVPQAEAEGGTASTRRAWTAQRVRQAINAWWQLVTSGFGRNFIAVSNESAARNVLQLTYPATAPTVGDGVEVLRAGAGGWLGQGGVSLTPLDYPATVADITNLTKTIRSEVLDNGVDAYAAGIHFSTADTWGRLRVAYGDSRAWVQGGVASSGAGWTAELYHSLNTLNIGTTATSARAALNLFADASGVMTDGPAQLSNDMSNFLSSMTFDEMAQKVGSGSGSGARPTKDHGNVAVTGSQTVTCNVQESDFHMMSMGTSNATGTLTIDFSNMPDTLGKHFSWHVRLQRGARKTVAFAQTINWAGGVAPTFGNSASSYDLMMFYKVGDETIRGMVIDAW